MPVPGKPEVFPKRGEVGRTNDPCPAAVGDRGMPESDVGKVDRDGDDISVFIPVSISLSASRSSSRVPGLGLPRPGDDMGVMVEARV